MRLNVILFPWWPTESLCCSKRLNNFCFLSIFTFLSTYTPWLILILCHLLRLIIRWFISIVCLSFYLFVCCLSLSFVSTIFNFLPLFIFYSSLLTQYNTRKILITYLSKFQNQKSWNGREWYNSLSRIIFKKIYLHIALRTYTATIYTTDHGLSRKK